jgi:hypothetical protein
MTFGSTFGRTFSPTFQPKSQAAVSGGFAPTDITGLALWLDYADTNSMFTDDGTTKVSASGDKIYRINDKSGNANHAYQTGTDTTRPTYLPNAQNGKSVGKFLRSAAQWNYWTSIGTIRTVFWMFKEVAQWCFASVLGDANEYNFHRSGNLQNLFWWGEYTSTYVNNGTLRVNASAIDGLSTNVPTSFSVCSLVTTGNVQANCFSKDRNTSRYFDGQLGELIIYTTALTGDQVSQVETYLNNKWAIY